MVACSPNPATQQQAPPRDGDLVPLSLLLDPRFTLDQLADQFHTTIEAISLWMLQPDIQDRIEIIEAASIQRTRIAATRALPAIATACHSIITTFNNTARPERLDPDDHAAAEQERRNAETARRAGALLLRLARFRRAPASVAPASPPVSQRADPAAHADYPASASSPTSHIQHPTSDIPKDLLALINSPDFHTALAAATSPASDQSRAAQAAGAKKVTPASHQTRPAQAAGAKELTPASDQTQAAQAAGAKQVPNRIQVASTPTAASQSPAPSLPLTETALPKVSPPSSPSPTSPNPQSEIRIPISDPRSRDPTARAA
jgi:hypothetical protein